MQFFKYRDNLAKKDKELLVQDPDTLTHLPMTINSKDLVEVKAKESTVESFYDVLDNSYSFDTIIQESITLQEQSQGVKRMLKLLISEANNKNVWLTDLHEYDYEKAFYQIIKDYRH